MNLVEAVEILKMWNKAEELVINESTDYDKTVYIQRKEAIETLLTAYEKEKEKNKNKDKILRNIREEFLKYDWKDANPIQTYNQLKSLYESIYCKPYED